MTVDDDSVEKSEADYLQKFSDYVQDTGVEATIIDCGTHTLTVGQAAEAVGCSPDQILKTLLFHDGNSGAVIAIAAGLARVDTAKLLETVALTKARLAKPNQVLEQLGYPAGGVPPIGLPTEIPVVMDTRAANLAVCYAGAGTTRHLARLDPAVILSLTGAIIAPIIQEAD